MSFDKHFAMVVFMGMVLGSLGAAIYVATNSVVMAAAVVAGSGFLLWMLDTISGSDIR